MNTENVLKFAGFLRERAELEVFKNRKRLNIMREITVDPSRSKEPVGCLIGEYIRSGIGELLQAPDDVNVLHPFVKMWPVFWQTAYNRAETVSDELKAMAGYIEASVKEYLTEGVKS